MVMKEFFSVPILSVVDGSSVAFRSPVVERFHCIGCYDISCLLEKCERKCVCQTITIPLASRMCYFSKNDLQEESSRQID